MKKMQLNQLLHRMLPCTVLFLVLPLVFGACENKIIEEDDQEERRLWIEMEMTNEVRKNLVGTWAIDTLDIVVEYSHPYFDTDTTLVKFGEINFVSWENVYPGTNPYY